MRRCMDRPIKALRTCGCVLVCVLACAYVCMRRCMDRPITTLRTCECVLVCVLACAYVCLRRCAHGCAREYVLAWVECKWAAQLLPCVTGVLCVSMCLRGWNVSGLPSYCPV